MPWLLYHWETIPVPIEAGEPITCLKDLEKKEISSLPELNHGLSRTLPYLYTIYAITAPN
jgi:hypothetical protein